MPCGWGTCCPLAFCFEIGGTPMGSTQLPPNSKGIKEFSQINIGDITFEVYI